jgi:hypothetical protein
MGKFVFPKIVTTEELRGMFEKELGSAYRVTVKKNMVEIVQDAAKGCAIQTKDKDGKTICSGPYSFMPSPKLALAVVLSFFVLLFVIGLSMGYLVVGIGVLPMIVLFLLMKVPSQKLVKRVAGILEKLARKV